MTLSDYRNFDLLIARAGEHYRAFVVDAPAGEASAVFDLPFAAGETTHLGGLVRGVSRHIGAAEDAGPAANLTELGQRLFAAVFCDKVGTLLAASLTSVTQEGAGLRLRLRFEEDAADLAALPWETLYDPTQAQFLGLGERSPILRYIALPRSRSALLVEPPLRVLALVSSPTGLAELDIEREWQAIQAALAGLVGDGKFVLERLASPTLAALQERLLGEPVHILHFVGHGVFDAAAQVGSLALEDAHGRPHLVRGEQLAALLRNHPALRLAYLNACEGALAAGGSVFTGVAQTLVREGVPAAVAMQAEISDAAAIELARTFYAALAAGRPVDAALTQARVTLSVADSPEWAIPVLFSRSPDNRLFDIRQVLPTPDCPYPGMIPFREEQEELFFGRHREIEEALARLRQHPFLAVVGPSGSGKSSLIYAGVLPGLRRSKRFGPGEWAVQTMRPGKHPLAALAERLGASPETLSSLALTRRTLLFVDQFEETFTLAEAGEAQTFLEALQGLSGQPNLFVLLTVRADFYPELMACSLWGPIRANRLELTPLGDDELWAAIVEPAAQVGVSVDEALAVQLIADAARQSGVLPLVQETMVLLWDRVKRRELKLAAYREMAEGGRSGLQVAIDRRASVVYDNLMEEAQLIARRIFLRLIQFGEGRADTRRQQTVDELRASGDDPVLFDQTLAALTASRLLTTSGEEGSARRVDIAHEALIAGWPRLQEWLGQRRAAEQTRRRLESKAAEWVAAEQRGGLLDAYELQGADTWLAGADAQELGYSKDLADLVKASKTKLEQERAEKAAQRQRELDQAKRLAKRFQFAVAATIIALILLVVAAYAVRLADIAQQKALAEAANAVKAQETAEAEASNARSAETTAQAEATRADQKAAEAMDAQATADAEAKNARAAEATAQAEARHARNTLARQLATQAELDSTESIPLGTLLALEAINGVLALGEEVPPEAKQFLRDILGRGSGGALYSGSHGLQAMAISPGRKWLAAGSSEGEVFLWDLRTMPTASSSIALQSHQGLVTDLFFSPDGYWLITGGLWDNEVHLWNLADDSPSQRYQALPLHHHSLSKVVVSPDGHWLVAGSDAGALYRWDLTSDNPKSTQQVFLGHKSRTSALAVSTDSRHLAVAGEDGSIQLLELSDFSRAAVIPQAHQNSVQTLLFASDGSSLVSMDWDTAKFWPLSNLSEITSTLVFSDSTEGNSPNPSLNVYASKKHAQFFIALGSQAYYIDGADADNVQAEVLLDHPSPITRLIVSADERWLVVGGKNGEIQLMDRSVDSRALWQLESAEGEVTDLVFSPDERWLVATARDDDVLLFALHETEPNIHPVLLRGHAGTVFNAPITKAVLKAAMSADNRWLFTAGYDSLRLWDLATIPGVDPLLLGEQALSMDYQNMALSFDDRWLALAQRDGNVELWDIENTPVLVHVLANRGMTWRSISFLANSYQLLGVATNGTTQMWDLDSEQASTPAARTLGSLASSLNRPDQTLSLGEVVVGADGRRIAFTTATEPGIYLWEIMPHSSSTPTATQAINVDSYVEALAISPNSRWLVAGDAQGNVHVWDLEDKRMHAQELSGHKGEFARVVFSADGHRFATASHTGEFYVWETDSGGHIHNAGSRTIAGATWIEASMSPSGRWLAGFGFPQNKLHLWDLEAPHQDAVLLDVADMGSVLVMAFSPNENWLAVAGGNENKAPLRNAIHLFDLRADNPADQVVYLKGHRDYVPAALFSAAGTHLITGSLRDPVRIWTLELEQIMRLACGMIGRNFKYNEWQRYFPQQPYRRTCLSLPIHPDVLDAGQELARTGRIEEALSLFAQIGAIAPESMIDPVFEVNQAIAKQHMLDGRDLYSKAFNGSGHEKYVEASHHFTAAIELEYQPAKEAFYWRGITFYRMYNYQRALQDLTKAIQLDPTDPILYDWRGATHYRLADFDPAIADFGQALKVAPTYATAHWWLGDIYQELAEFEDARFHYQQAADLGYRVEELAYKISSITEQQADLLIRQGLYEAAYTLLTHNADNPPYSGYNPVATMTWKLSSHARVLVGEGDWDGALKALQIAAEHDPNSDMTPAVELASMLRAQASALIYQNHDHAAALDLLRKAVKYNPALDIDPEAEAGRMYASVMVEEGRQLAWSGDVAGALTKFEAALALDKSLVASPPEYVQLSCALSSGESLLTSSSTLCAQIDFQVSSIAVGDTVTGTYSGRSSDFWSLDAAAPVTVTINFGAEDSGLDANLYLYASDGSIVAEKRDLSDKVSIEAMSLLPGRYAIGVSAYPGSSGTYRLAVSMADAEP